MNRKLKLDVEDLSVESFRINPSADEKRGTVRGNSSISFDATCDCTSDITAVSCATEPFGGCSEPGMTWGGSDGSRVSAVNGVNQGFC